MSCNFAILSFLILASFSLISRGCSCDDIQTMVSESEGNRPCVYTDTLGHPTIGIGFNLDRSDARSVCSALGIDYDAIRSGSECLTSDQITQIFNQDLQTATQGAENCVPSFDSQPNCVQNVLIDMTFNMGASSLCSWPNFIKQLGNGDYNGAAQNMEGSKWCGQVGNRCTRDSGIMVSCAASRGFLALDW